MLGFIVTRCVKEKKYDSYWQISVNFIRKYYKENLIIIIDDNSKQELLSDVKINNTIVIQSEFPGAGELLPYYYFHKNKWFDKAVIIHDSVFIKQNIDFNSLDDLTLFWNFPSTTSDYINDNEKMISYLDNSDKVLELYRDKNKWFGCFGVMSIISHDFLDKIQNKYNIFKLLEYVKCRQDRYTLERIFGVLFILEKPGVKVLFNSILDFLRNGNNKNIEKIFSGR